MPPGRGHNVGITFGRPCINPGRFVSVAWHAGGCSLRGTWVIKDDEDVSIDYCINRRIITTRKPTSTCTYPRQQSRNPTPVPVVLSLPFPTCQELSPIDGSYIIFSAYCPIITHCCLLPVRRYRVLRLVAPGAVPASSAVAAQSIHLDEPHSPLNPPVSYRP